MYVRYLGSQERDASSVSPEVEEGGLVAEKTELITIASPIGAVQLVDRSEQHTQIDRRKCNREPMHNSIREVTLTTPTHLAAILSTTIKHDTE